MQHLSKAVFLDRDGTINVEKQYLYKKEEFEFLPGVLDGLKLLQKAGYLLVIVTNQSGIARGYYSEDQFHDLNNWMLSKLEEYGITITKVYYCPHHPNAIVEKYKMDCECRKPKLGMYQMAVQEYGIDLNNSYAIGDKIRDCAICKDSGCKGILIQDNEAATVISDVKKSKYRNVIYRETLLDAAEYIVSKVEE
ncbi:MAG: D-glycero-beta-D-manno-heptose 1,7-bisphosphate 7-phosphatase [Lachnospiraceae bacterium]|nr:D-glycero-beta-D-manno-heptose 1,7-bisphosphate 7-phosphatase [Lachnospiraceae bacterium]